MSKKEFVSPEGFRQDGRRVTETRAVSMRLGGVCSNEADGSAYVEMGSTKAIAYVCGPMEKGRRRDANKGSVNVTFTMAPFATQDRRRRSQRDKISLEMAFAIRQTFEAAILLDQIPRATVDIQVHVIEAGGGEKSAAIIAVCLALVDAGVPLNDLVVSASAGIIGSTAMVDTSHDELGAASANMTMAVEASTRKVLLLDLDAKIAQDQLDPLWEVCVQGCEHVLRLMQATLKDNLRRMISYNRSLEASTR
uniref:Uncharacterized protein n=1 Tax=Chromera velia CCMP2878 TaxID=1169474 RepID=A0A0G4GXL2_9ALVE|mmetsp:Transcript_43071/g.84927  ORF Transcript_43071/g.84927 Transcript_43071/m.84927 type:complete len:251 (+) Transcript_43071:257-1009(+)|eukprot:Cvel_23757.t1-p1 / transcript=Cvel_23757.t1 / gene=Cvel_23757 / organism=Chromera_velia_CCMP2878 / gene_product=Exosome complex component RRP41, putative / transcript_product=Exosome complex component RRP41, putative / location=Cvel_scaffold2489:6484-7233(+) / protein_length=250 / sequence_SO=supercontig / SO=protein_coding / is_pseudo=false